MKLSVLFVGPHAREVYRGHVARLAATSVPCEAGGERPEARVGVLRALGKGPLRHELVPQLHDAGDQASLIDEVHKVDVRGVAEPHLDAGGLTSLT